MTSLFGFLCGFCRPRGLSRPLLNRRRSLLFSGVKLFLPLLLKKFSLFCTRVCYFFFNGTQSRFLCLTFWNLGKLLSEPMVHWRAQMLRRKTHLSGRSGQGDACEERAQGNGETLVRVMRHQARTRRGGGIPPTKHRDANGGCSAREESSFSPKRATNMRRLDPAPEGATRGHGRVTAERSEGRA